jgi:hypothetical protein
MSEYTERELHMLAQLREIHNIVCNLDDYRDPLDAFDEIRARTLPFVITGPQETEPEP